MRERKCNGRYEYYPDNCQDCPHMKIRLCSGPDIDDEEEEDEDKEDDVEFITESWRSRLDIEVMNEWYENYTWTVTHQLRVFS